MQPGVEGFRSRARAQADELLQAISAAETVIVSTIERECEALRAGRLLAAKALHTRLRDAARLYLHATKAARAVLWTIEKLVPGTAVALEEQRADFSSLLKVELAVLASERAMAGEEPLHLRFADEPQFPTVLPEPAAKRIGSYPRSPAAPTSRSRR